MVEGEGDGAGSAGAAAAKYPERKYASSWPTQFALLSSLEALGRVFAGRPSADIVALVGWTQFFVLTVVVALPGLWAVWRIRRSIEPEQKAAVQTSVIDPAASPVSD